ncbi:MULTISPECIES: isochorismatase family protein [Citricoccus]|uniref:Isochorismatase family protein n=1 Tax=Citricoccus muralis TaxID=169134 RepID=A0ABY8H5H3_9MICC|nr:MULTISPECIES: isochorismatase family protein [Citricoccus]WBL20128.1 isochorismatase family protein [Citricoccus sp. NR2]WFP16350.1 isochorismatase family protein [Citricoccus muralis]
MVEETREELEAQLEVLLEKVFKVGAEEYYKRGFKRRVGYGNRPAIVHIDMANAWTREGHPFTCRGVDGLIDAIQQVNTAARAKGVPIFYTTNVYEITDSSVPNDMGLWHSKIPVESLPADSYWAQIDDRIAPEGNDIVLEKRRASAFPGTDLQLFLAANHIDTLIITGCTAAGCVRHTAEDALAYGYRPILVKEAIGDRVPGVVQWNLFDIDSKFGDVEPLADVLNYLNTMPPFGETVPKPSPDRQIEVDFDAKNTVPVDA